jgi:hyperosmotically inducible protein
MKKFTLHASLITALLVAAAVPISASYAASTQALPQVAQATDRTAGDSALNAGMTIKDTTITNKVKAALEADRQSAGLGIDVTTTQGVVVVRGTVPNNDASHHVIELISSVDGVQDVRNELKIQGAS